MKIENSFLRKIQVIYIIAFVLFSCKTENKENKISNFKTKSKIRKSNIRHKKGIEYMADYQHSIRKPIDAENSTYEKGYLIKEFNKAKKNSFKNKAAKNLNPIFTERGPFNVPGRTRGIAVDAQNNQRWFVGTVGGGVWKTENSGSSWINLTDNQMPNLATSTIVISPQDSKTLYVGTGEPFGNLGAIGGSGIFKSIDGGITWTSLTGTSNFGDIGRIIINPNDKNNVIVAAQRGIYRTTDGGLNWIQTYSSSGTVQDLDADPTNFNIQYASVSRLGVLKSINGGITWSIALNKNSFNADHRRFETSVSKANPNTIFVSVYTPSEKATVGVNTDFYVSRNKGITFTNLQTTGSASSANLLTGQGWYDNVIMGHPYDENIFYVGGVAVFKVTISGSTFSSKSIASGYDGTQINRSVHVDQHGLKTILGNNEEFRIVLANDGGIFSTKFSETPGELEGDWSSKVLGKNSTQFYGATKQNGQDNYLAGAQDNGSWISQNNNSDKSKNYTFVFGGDGYEALWHYDKPGDFLVTSQFGRVGRYVNYNYVGTANIPDAGNNTISPFYSKISSTDNNPDAVFVVSKNGVWRSTDFGENWELTSITDGFSSNGSSSLNVEVSTADPNVVWAGKAMREDGSFSLHVSEDNGQTFKKVNSYNAPNYNHNLNISGIGTSPTQRNRAYALFSSQGVAKVLKTEDLGTTWQDITGQGVGKLPDVAVHSILEMPFDKNKLWAGTDIGLFETSDGGNNWIFVNKMIPVAVYDMKIVNNQVVIATYGRGIWSATLNELNNYNLPAYLKLPEVTTSQNSIQSVKTKVTFNVTSDDINRIKVFVDDVEQTELIQDFKTGESYSYETAELSEGNHKVGIQLFDDSNNRSTLIKETNFNVINFDNPSENIGINEFKNTDVYNINGSFKIDKLDGIINTNVLNNIDHPYKNGTAYQTILKKPLIISDANKDFKYSDAAIIEPFTDNLADLNRFYDFVIIEASTDLKTWKTLDKYDSRRFPEWLNEYNKGSNAKINDNLFKTQTITLTEKGFSIGDTIVIRFSLVTDPGVNSFGWAIKSIGDAVASINDVINNNKTFSIYPTVSNGNFTLFGKNNLGKSKVRIFDLNGKEVYKSVVDFNTNEKQEISVNLKSGAYIINVLDENNKRASNKIIIK